MAYAEKVYKVRNGRTTKQFTWRARYKKPDGTWGSEPGFPTKTRAEDWGEEQEAEIRAGRWIDPDLARGPFGTWAKEWMTKKTARGRTTGFRWYLLETFILPKWDHTPLNAMNWLDVDGWQQTIPAEDDIRRNCVTLMSQIITGAVDAKRLIVNPLFGRRRTKPVAPAWTQRSAEAAKRRADDEQVPSPEAVLRLADRLGPGLGMHVLTTAFTGLRWGEGAGLHRDNVLVVREQPDGATVFSCPTIRVVEELAEYEQRGPAGERLGTALLIEPPKSEKSTRMIDLPPFVAVLLRHHLDDWPHPYVFCTSTGKFWRRHHFGKKLRPAADGRPAWRGQGAPPKEGWEPIEPGLTMRKLRKLHDSLQDQIGVKESLAHEQAGHKRAGIKGVYQRPTPTMRRERLDGLQDVFERAMHSLGQRTLWGRVDLRKIS